MEHESKTGSIRSWIGSSDPIYFGPETSQFVRLDSMLASLFESREDKTLKNSECKCMNYDVDADDFVFCDKLTEEKEKTWKTTRILWIGHLKNEQSPLCE